MQKTASVQAAISFLMGFSFVAILPVDDKRGEGTKSKNWDAISAQKFWLQLVTTS